MTSIELTEKINAIFADLTTNLTKANAGNKSAAVRARKNTVELEKLFKEYRKVSVEESKQ